MSKQYVGLYLCLFSLFSITAVAIWILWPDSPEREKFNNEQYLKRLASLVCKYRERRGHIPEDFDEVLENGHLTLSHRGDFYGRRLWYQRACDSAFFLRASNVEQYYADCHSVSKSEFATWVRSHPDKGQDADGWLVVYGF
jgi:hypothetical protein